MFSYIILEMENIHYFKNKAQIEDLIIYILLNITFSTNVSTVLSRYDISADTNA